MAENRVPVKERVFGPDHFLRPSFIEPYGCRNVLIEGVTLLHSPMWNVHPVLSSNVIVRGLTINSAGPNTDGCDPESCTDVLIDSAEVVDPRTLAPLDSDTIVRSVKKTGRLVLVDQAPRHSSAAVVIAAEVAEKGFDYLRAPITMVTALDTSIPYSEPLESYVLPNEEKIVHAVHSVVAERVVRV